MTTLLPIQSPSQEVLPRSRQKRSATSRSRRVLRAWPYYLALLPTFVLLGVFGYYPAINGFYHAFYDWEPGFYANFTGLANFAYMLHDTLFWESFKNIAQFFVFGITVAWILPIFAAELVMTLTSERWRFFFRSLLIAPFAFPIAVQVLLWGFLYDPNVGVFNTILRTLGLGALAHNWLGDPHTALYALMFINVPWIASIPFLIFLARLQAIPQEVFDAALLDGAGRVRRCFSVDIPLMIPQFRLLLVLAVIQILQYAVPVALLTNGGPAYATMMPVLYLVQAAFVDSNWGYAAALSAVLFLLMFVASLFMQRISRQS